VKMSRTTLNMKNSGSIYHEKVQNTLLCMRVFLQIFKREYEKPFFWKNRNQYCSLGRRWFESGRSHSEIGIVVSRKFRTLVIPE